MIPAAFDYVRAASVDEAVDALAQHGDGARILAGGHSLLPLMRLRLSFPEVLIDVGRIDDLRGVREDGDHLVIGAMTTHHDVITDPLVRQHCGVLAEVTQEVGDPAVRNRGTIGGAAAHADPAGDQPAALLALDAEFVAQGRDGRRTIAAADFFQDYLSSALNGDEVLVEIRLPKLGSDWSWNFQKFQRVAQAWAIVGSCALVRHDDGEIGEARVGLVHMGSTPLRASATEDALAGVDVSDGDAIRAAAEQAAEGTSPTADQNAQPDYRRHLARVLTRRAVEAAVQ
ncbi:MAG: xanthine dehydrogenase family protein subunit M [Nitriliruptorales bacterium]|nr:xanthine dehydrogenase family protein subunit M [Nitriliruptorales bacterium]